MGRLCQPVHKISPKRLGVNHNLRLHISRESHNMAYLQMRGPTGRTPCQKTQTSCFTLCFTP